MLEREAVFTRERTHSIRRICQVFERSYSKGGTNTKHSRLLVKAAFTCCVSEQFELFNRSPIIDLTFLDDHAANVGHLLVLLVRSGDDQNGVHLEVHPRLDVHGSLVGHLLGQKGLRVALEPVVRDAQTVVAGGGKRE